MMVGRIINIPVSAGGPILEVSPRLAAYQNIRPIFDVKLGRLGY